MGGTAFESLASLWSRIFGAQSGKSESPAKESIPEEISHQESAEILDRNEKKDRISSIFLKNKDEIVHSISQSDSFFHEQDKHLDHSRNNQNFPTPQQSKFLENTIDIAAEVSLIKRKTRAVFESWKVETPESIQKAKINRFSLVPIPYQPRLVYTLYESPPRKNSKLLSEICETEMKKVAVSTKRLKTSQINDSSLQNIKPISQNEWDINPKSNLSVEHVKQMLSYSEAKTQRFESSSPVSTIRLKDEKNNDNSSPTDDNSSVSSDKAVFGSNKQLTSRSKATYSSTGNGQYFQKRKLVFDYEEKLRTEQKAVRGRVFEKNIEFYDSIARKVDADEKALINELFPKLSLAPIDSEDKMKPLFTPEEEDLYDEAMSTGSLNEVLSEFAKIPVTREKILSLRPGIWLNDEIINFYGKLLQETSRRIDPANASYFFSTFFMPKITEGGYNYRNVARWTKRGANKCDIFTQRYVFFPLNINETHWTLLVVDIRDKKLIYLDSLGGRGEHYLRIVLRYLEDELMDKRKEKFNQQEWKLQSMGSSVPQQRNGSDCGVFTLTFALFLMMDQPLKFSQKDMNYFRKRIAVDILNKRIAAANV